MHLTANDNACFAEPFVPPFTNDEVYAETWRNIPGLLEGYQVSSLGRIWVPSYRSVQRGFVREAKMAKPRCLGNGYLGLMVWTADGTTKRTVYVHELVTLAFHGPRPVGLQIRHLDSNCLNNRADNLCYGTAKQNSQDAVALGRHPHGETHGRAKITAAQVQEIRDLRGVYTQAEIASMFGIARTTVSGVQNRRCWTHLN